MWILDIACSIWNVGYCVLNIGEVQRGGRNVDIEFPFCLQDKPSRLVRGVWERLRVFKQLERAAQHLQKVKNAVRQFP